MNIDNFKKLSELITEDKVVADKQGYCTICAYSLHNAKGLIGKCQHCFNFSLWKWRYEITATTSIKELNK